MYKSKRGIWLFILPGFLLMAVFVFFPLVLNVFYSLFRWSAFSQDKLFVGLDYYKRMLEDPIIRLALKNNILYAVCSVVCQCGLGLILAAILENGKMRKYQTFFRTAYFIPSIISITVIGLLWQFVYNPKIGVVNPLLELLGLGKYATDWLGQSNTAMGSVIFVSQWQNIGYIMLLFIVAIQKIDESIFESAIIDGANGFQNFIHILVPLVKDTILVTSVITVIGAFRVFSEIYVMTGGGPGHTTETLASYMYRVGFRNDEMGYSATVSTLIFVILLVLTFIQMKVSGNFKQIKKVSKK
ncbi:MAG: sugar ABC transporter permease [Ruthenibacterium sp.]